MRRALPPDTADLINRAHLWRRLWPVLLVVVLAVFSLAAFAIWASAHNARSAALADAQSDALQLVERIGEVEPRVRTEEALVLGGLIALRNASEDDCPLLHDGPLLLRITASDGRTAGTPGWSPGNARVGSLIEGSAPSLACTGRDLRFVGVVEQVGDLTIATGRTYRSFLGGGRFWMVAGTVAVLALLTIAVLSLHRQEKQRRDFARLAEQIDRMGRGDLSHPIVSSGDADLQAVVALVNRLAARMSGMFDNMRRLQGFVTHDIGNPLMVAERLLVRSSAAETGDRGAQGYSAQALEQVRLADRRRRAALDLITASTPAERPRTAQVDPRERIDRLVESMFTYLAEDRDLDLSVSGEIDPIAALPEQFDRMIENVLLNAVQHAEPGSTIDITLSRQEETGLIRVSNRGEGVSEAIIDRIFENGVRAGDQMPGYGIGLAITRTIAQACGGRVTGRNTAEGFCVEIQLPKSGGDYAKI